MIPPYLWVSRLLIQADRDVEGHYLKDMMEVRSLEHKILFYFFRERGREREREKNIN